MKQFFLKLFVLCIICMTSNNVFAYDCEVDGIYYDVIRKGEAKVTNSDSKNLYFANSYSGKVVIPSQIEYDGKVYKVTTIGEAAFYGCSSLTSISIPNSVNKIDYNAFFNCDKLEKVIIPDIAVWCATEINSNPLEYAHSLYSDENTEIKDLVIPDGVTSIGERAFWGCSSLASVNIPDGVTSIGENAFYQCTSLASVSIPESITTIGMYAFYGCTNMAAIDIPDGVKTIGESAFCGCKSLTSIRIPNSVDFIASGAFSGCDNLKHVYINMTSVGDLCDAPSCIYINAEIIELGDSVKHIGEFFYDSKVKEITIPEGITYIANNAFRGFKDLKSATILTPKVPENSFSGCTSLENVSFGEKVTDIGKYAFARCSNLKSINIPNSITFIGEAAFQDCTGLNDIVLPERGEISVTAFQGCTGLTTATINTPVVLNWFAELTNLKEVTLSEKTTTIDDYAFQDCTSLDSINIPFSVTSIGYKAFADCTSLKSLVLPGNLDFVSDNAFDVSTKLQVNKGTKSLLALWKTGNTNTWDKETYEQLSPTLLKFDSSTQTTAIFNVENVYPEYKTTYNGITLEDKQILLTGLRPEEHKTMALNVALGDYVYSTEINYETKGLNLKTNNEVSATSFTLKGNYDKGDAKVIGERLELNGKKTDGNELFVGGLEPQSSYDVTYIATVRYGNNEEYEEEYSTIATINTGKLELTTLAPKVIKQGEVIVAATSNITNDDEKVGFEWRRTDAPEEINSRSGEAFLYKGKMEGYLHNLTSFNYWRFRPYYESASGKRFYGNWGVLEADDYSYFEPTVHTYDNISVDGNEAEVKGYVTRGSDDVEEQGFMYWMAESEARSYGDSRRTTNVPDNAKSVMATGQVMTANIRGLAYECTYKYVAYVKTAKGDTYYGEVQSFITGETPSGIHQTPLESKATIVARYDTQGRLILVPTKGLNILRMSDGTTRKVMMK